MREFVDDDGTKWEVVVGRESWGAVYALFIPDGKGSMRQALLETSSYLDAIQDLQNATPSELARLFHRSAPSDGVG